MPAKLLFRFLYSHGGGEVKRNKDRTILSRYKDTVIMPMTVVQIKSAYLKIILINDSSLISQNNYMEGSGSATIK